MISVNNGVFLQYASTFAVSIITVNIGMSLVWPSPMLPKLYSNDSPIGIKLTGMEGSWVTSCLLMGALCGNFIVGLSFDYFGRKRTLLISAFPIITSWLITSFARSVETLYIARFILGLGTSCVQGTAMTYVSEIAEPSRRGKCFVIIIFMTEIGQLTETIIGAYCSYLCVGIINATTVVVFFVSFYTMPESPYFYVRKNNLEMAENALERLRGRKRVMEELKEIQVNVEETMQSGGTLRELFRNKSYRKPLFILFGLKTLYQFSGSIAIQSYMKTIFEVANTGLDSNISSIICVSIILPSVLIAGYLIDRIGRKPLYYISTIGVTIALLLEAIYFFIATDRSNENLPAISWIPVTGIFFSYIFRAFGIASLSTSYMAELFAPNIKGIASSVCLIYGSLLSVVVSFSFAPFSIKFGMGVSFLIFSGFCLAGFVFVLLFVPETKCKTLIQIQDEMKSSKLKISEEHG